MTTSGKIKILIVDDDEAIHKMIPRAFPGEPLEFISAFNGIEALRIAEAEKPALILLDVNMPEMNGNEAMKRLQANKATFGIPVIMLTGNGEAIDTVVGYELGVQDYITKPFELDNLKQRVKKILSDN